MGWGVLSLMLLVAVAALCFALIKSGAEYKRQRDRYLSLATYHAKCAQNWARRKPKKSLQVFTDLNLAEERYHRALEQKYLQAATKPWKAVEPDPPSPRFPAKDILKEMKQKEQELRKKYQKSRGEDPPRKEPLDII